jgi:hypothetical protein
VSIINAKAGRYFDIFITHIRGKTAFLVQQKNKKRKFTQQTTALI